MPSNAEPENPAPLPSGIHAGAMMHAGEGPAGPAVRSPISEADITVAPLDFEGAIRSLRSTGVVLLRGAVGRGVIEQVRQATVRAFERLPQVAPTGGPAAKELMRLSMIGPGLTDGFSELTEMARRVVECGVGKPIVELYLGGRLIFDTSTLRFRSHRPSRTLSYVPLHQDAAFTAQDRSWINFWVPLSPCGEVAPGLEIYPLPEPKFFPHVDDPSPGGYPMGFIRDEALASYPHPLAPVEPIFEPGDLLLFDGFCPHRTIERPGMTQTRYSFEFRYSSENSQGPRADGPRQERRTARAQP